MWLAVSLLILGLVLLVWSADRLVFGAAALAKSFHVPPLIIGMTIVGMGTSAPEMVVSATAAFSGHSNTAVGNAIGSNIANILLILGVVAIICPLKVNTTIIKRELPIMLGVSALAGILLYNNYLGREESFILLAVFALFMLYMTHLARHAARTGSAEPDDDIPEGVSRGWASLWLIIGLIVLPLSSKLMVDNATFIAHALGMSELIIGLTVIAIGTSLPELATSVTGALKGEDDMALGNIIGSNIFNILTVLGIPALISPFATDPAAFSRDFMVMMGASLFLAALCLRRSHRIGRIAGVLLLGSFIGYLAMLLQQMQA
ncbi:calcium/sodium antiporter [Plesiomonas sp.]|uniref:calcium/sodium antiporter n=1 Tax=Plesiomonas sp. TaxID=2486279 RepID=UPI003F3CC2E7